MPAFNVVQKRRRAAISEHKRARHGDPLTAKLKQKPQSIPISGKRKRKLFKKWRRVGFILLFLSLMLFLLILFASISIAIYFVVKIAYKYIYLYVNLYIMN